MVNSGQLQQEARMWVISTCKGPHSCSSFQLATDGRMMDSKFISIALEKYVLEDLTQKVKNLHSMLHAKHGHDVTMYKVWEAKQKAVAHIYEDFDESYVELPRFLTALSDVDPDTVTTLKCDLVSQGLVYSTLRFELLVHVLEGSGNTLLWQVQRKAIDSNRNRW